MISGTPGLVITGGSAPSSPTIGATTLSLGNLPSASTIPLAEPLSSRIVPSGSFFSGNFLTIGAVTWGPTQPLVLPLKIKNNNNVSNSARNSHNNHHRHPLRVIQCQKRLYHGIFLYCALKHSSLVSSTPTGDLSQPVNSYAFLGFT